jgi:very-short-patch-repair endonuclease
MLPRAPREVALLVPREHNPRPQAGVTVLRRDLEAQVRVLDRGIAVTAPALTVLHTTLALPDGATFLDRALQRHVSFPAVLSAYRRSLGRPGSAELGRLLVAAVDRAASAAERELVRILRGAGITGWTLDHPFGAYDVDLVFLRERVAIEVDGWAWHTDPERFGRDRRKGNALVGEGWRLLRFTWHDLTTAPDRVLADIRRTLARAA